MARTTTPTVPASSYAASSGAYAGANKPATTGSTYAASSGVTGANTYKPTYTASSRATTPSTPKPSTPSTPSRPSTPSTPKPSTPSTPSRPSTPSTPSTPSRPTTPSTPSRPTTPSTPSRPTTPSTPSRPTTPSTPNRPTTPGRPTTPPKDDKPGNGGNGGNGGNDGNGGTGNGGAIAKPIVGTPGPGIIGLMLSLSDIEEMIPKLRQASTDLKDVWSKTINSTVAKIENSWAGEDARIYTDKVQALDPRVDKVCQAIDLLAQTYQKVLDRSRTTVSEVSQKISSISIN